MAEFDLEKAIEQLRSLEEERAELLTKPLSPEGAWIHQYTKIRKYPSGFVGEYTYAKWQANEAIFGRKPRQLAKRQREKEAGINQNPVKHQHIGRVGSNSGLPMDEEVKVAYEAWHNRLRLEAIEKVLKRIAAILENLS